MKSGFAAIKAWLGGLVQRIGFDPLKSLLSDLLTALEHIRLYFHETPVLGIKSTGYEGGDCAIKLFEEASPGEKILVTHYSTEGMSPEYLAAQQMALERGVHVTRLIPEGHDHPIVPERYFEWLDEFPDTYKIIVYKGAPLPLDFVVLGDDRKVLLGLPEETEGHEAVDKLTVALTLTDTRLVRAFSTLFKRLLPPPEDKGDGADQAPTAKSGSGFHT